jgi:hypothetical protein
MGDFLAVFERLKNERAAEFQSRHGLVIKTGEGLGAAILKVMKPSWTTDAPEDLLNSNGLFFGVWVDAECVAKGIARYNLHAKKLRFIKGDTFASREFARSFRAGGAAHMAGWPNWSFPKGPITLFEGHVPLDVNTLEAETSALMDRFVDMVPRLETMLAA